MSLDPWSYAEKTRSENAEQVALFMWANMACNFGLTAANCASSYNIKGAAQDLKGVPIPELEWLHAIKNEEKSGSVIRGAMSKAAGVKAGVPDIFLPVPTYVWLDKKSYHGLYIELKRLKSARGSAGKASEQQIKWHSYLNSAGYKAVVCYGWEAARNEILAYLGRG